MSASLVGSEMCIRDRRMRQPGWIQASRPARRRPPNRRHAKGRPTCDEELCLLYTSDAADDM
eukprot:14751407-Alexandrium_andersonii.AAC.1